MAAEHAKPLRPDLQHVPGEHRQQAGRPAEQHREQVKGDGPEHQLVAPNVPQPFSDLGGPRPARLDRRLGRPPGS